ncbi:MAG: NTP transferase domain-containing protein [Haloquadratum sp.]|jgi:adenosylcobinamide-phosphate guanylyltransferase|nr:NTP transferase domain-containing protein [Haloferacaceae archaeon]MDR9445591.1 NTP transferase domain-containing protein [Haloquadratum sp.]
MDAVVMCGGRGTRLGTRTEKPLVEVGGRPMLARVIAACQSATPGHVYAATSTHTPRTRAWADAHGVPVIDTPGAGYVADLDAVMATVDMPFLSITADIPGVAPRHLRRLLAQHAESDSAVTAVTATGLKRWLGCSVAPSYGDASVVPVGLNVVDRSDGVSVLLCDPAVSINVNTPTDLQIARARCV